MPVAHLNMYLIMAGAAQAHQIAPVVCAASAYGEDMMDFFCRNGSAILQAHFAKGMSRGIAVTDPLPGSAVLFVYSRSPFVQLVIFVV